MLLEGVSDLKEGPERWMSVLAGDACLPVSFSLLSKVSLAQTVSCWHEWND